MVEEPVNPAIVQMHGACDHFRQIFPEIVLVGGHVIVQPEGVVEVPHDALLQAPMRLSHFRIEARAPAPLGRHGEGGSEAEACGTFAFRRAADCGVGDAMFRTTQFR